MKKILLASLLLLALSGCSSKPSADINDMNSVLDFAYENYKATTKMETPIADTEFKKEGTYKTLVADLNSDGTDDVLVYSPLDVNSQFDVVSAITVKNGKFELIPSEIENFIDYGQEFTFEDNLLIRNLNTGGTGVSVNFAQIYIPKTDKIYYTKMPILMNGQSSFQNKTNNIETEKTGTWDNFVLKSKATILEDNKVAADEVANYVLDKENNQYTKTVTDSYYMAEEVYVYPREKVSEADFVNTEFHKRVPNASYSEYVESLENRTLEGLKNETFGSETTEYENSYLVLIPMYESVNRHFTEKRTISFDGEYINELKFTVFGELQDVVVNQYNSIDGKPETIELGDLTNTEVTIRANLSNDNSRVEVIGQFYEGEGTYSEKVIKLDKMRDLSEYKIETVKK